MTNTYTLIASNTLGSSAASVTFSSIPGTYTDLVLKWSVRYNSGDPDSFYDVNLTFNGSNTGYSMTTLYGNGSSVGSQRTSNAGIISLYSSAGGTGTTSNTFNNNELYIPNYTASQEKQISNISAGENNATAAQLRLHAGLWRNTAAITEIKLALNQFVSGSSFFLYGIKNS